MRLLLLLPLVLFFACSPGTSTQGDFSVRSVALEGTPGTDAFVPNLDGPLRPIAATPNGAMAFHPPGLTVSVTFSRPIVSLGDAPEPPENALRLDPAVPGTLRWEGTQTLVFEPEQPLPNATAFRATVSGITALDDEPLTEPYSWTFETPRPALLASDPADGSELIAPNARIRLVFNQPIDLASTRQQVSLRQEGNLIRTTLRAESDSVLVLEPGRGLAKGMPYEVQLAPGLRGQQGPLSLEEARTITFTTYGDLRFDGITQPHSYWEEAPTTFNPERGVTLIFSTPVKFEDLRQAVTFSPAAPLQPGAEARDGVVSRTHHLPVELQPETAYTVTVRELTDAFGQTLREASKTFRTRGLDPSVRMPTGLLVVEAQGPAAIPLRATNVQNARLGIRRLNADQIVPNLPTYDENRYYGEDVERGTPVAATRTLDLSATRNRPTTIPLTFDSLLTGKTGVLALHVVGPRLPGQPEARSFRAIAQFTNLGLSAKFSPHQNLILVTDLATAQPVAGAQVEIRDRTNTVRWRGQTDDKGRAISPGWAALNIERASEWEPPVQYAIVRRGEDLAFTSSQSTPGLEPWRFEVNYDWNPQEKTSTGTVFTDRGLYRAGETVNLKAILRTRTDRDWRAYTDSVRVTIRSPRDQDVFERTFKPSAMGTFDFTWTAPPGADQGLYYVRVEDPNEEVPEDDYYWQPSLADGTFRVDAFRTATFVVNVNAEAPAYVAGDFFEGTIEGRYLFGATMGGQPVRYSLSRQDFYHQPEGYPGFFFGPISWDYDGYYGLYQQLEAQETTLDAEGQLQVRHQLPGNDLGRPASIVLEASVTDPARQELSGRRTVTLHPALFYVGLKPQTTFIDLSQKRELSVDVATVDPAGVPVGGKDVTVELIRQQWTSVREVGSDGRLTWRSERIEEVKGTQRVRTERGKAQRLTMPVAEGGSYIIRATGYDVRGNRVRTDAYFYATGRGYTAWERNDDDRIELVAEKTQYAPGETARVLVPNPYEEATALITVERDGILSSSVQTLRGSSPQISIPLTEDHLPNVFVSVMLLHGRAAAPGPDADAGAPSFKIGYVELKVDAGARHLTVDVEPQRGAYRPGDEVTVALTLRDREGRGVPGEIAFSAADAGVLNLIGYRLPDPFDTFYGARPLGVTTSETRAILVRQRDFGDKEEDLGGGGGLQDDMLRKDFRPLAHWAPALRTDRSGKVSVTFKLPESLTTFRLMATGLTANHQFGNGSTDIVVTQPLVLQPALPRFARLGDTFEAGVLVTNTTGRDGTATVAVEAEGIALEGERQKTVALPNGQTREVRFRWRVPAVQPATLRFTATLGNERDAFEIPLSIALPTTRLTTATFASTDDTAQEAFTPPANRIPDLGAFNIRLASTALVGLDGALEYLFNYPYGCLEQQTSAIRPLLIANNLLDAFGLEAFEDANRKELIQAWLDLLPQYWTGNGFSLWPGARYDNPYVSAYVLLAMAEARAAGFNPPGDIQQQATQILAQRVRQRSDRPSYYSVRAWNDSRALMLYALARNGEIIESEIAALAQAPASELSVEGTAHVLRTITAASRPALNRYRQPLMDRLQQNLQVESTTAYLRVPDDGLGWIFASDTRATAHGLTALTEANPDADFQQLAQRMVRYLMQQRQGGHWSSTQENAVVVDAFRAFYEKYEQADPNFTAQVQVAGREVLQETFRGRSLNVADQSLPLRELSGNAERTVTLRKSGTGRLYYSLRLDAYSAAPQEARSQGLSVQRVIQKLDAGGNPVGSAQATGSGTITLVPGDLVRVTLRITSPTGRNYVVVDDALPAGLEALNAAFLTTNREVQRSADAGQDRWWGGFNYTQIKDDRVLLFADYLTSGEHTYTYVARATTPGTFVHPPAVAEMMYQPETMGRTATGTLTVQAPTGTGAN